jgi:hypothetical protein
MSNENVPSVEVTTSTPETAAKSGRGRRKSNKIEFPLLAEGKLDHCPADWKEDKHKPLQKADFDDELHYLQWKSMRFQRLADKNRKAAEQLEAMGSKEKREAIMSYAKILKKQKELLATIAESGGNVANIEELAAQLEL